MVVSFERKQINENFAIGGWAEGFLDFSLPRLKASSTLRIKTGKIEVQEAQTGCPFSKVFKSDFGPASRTAKNKGSFET